MENYTFKIKRRLYPGQLEAIPTQLPQDYVAETHSTVRTGENCETCFFNQNGFCNYWKSKIKNNFWCDEWRDPFSTAPLPTAAPCLTGTTIPILLTQDFNDIGVYTPWDGLAIQRDVISNFVYTGQGNSITVFNTSDVEFKKFLTLSPYSVDWGDGTTNQLATASQTVISHTYATPSSGYTITLSQINPWGSTFISKTVPIPYANTPVIPNPFGHFSVQAPNFGDPIGCDILTQSWLFWGDSNPDVWDYFSLNHVITPFAVTGYSYNSQLNMLKQYGNVEYPPVGNVVPLSFSGTGVINNITSWYTSYTINDMLYMDYSGGVTTYSAMSMGIYWDNVGYKCCDEEEEGCDCTNEVQIYSQGQTTNVNLSTLTVLGNGNLGPYTTGYAYILGDIVTAPSLLGAWDCCYVCLHNYYCDAHEPSNASIWGACDDCRTGGSNIRGGGVSEGNNYTDRFNPSYSANLGAAGAFIKDPNALPQLEPVQTPPRVSQTSGILTPERLFECVNGVCSEQPQGSWVDTQTGQSNYQFMLSQPNVFSTEQKCLENCGCVSIEGLELTINNISTCSTISVTNSKGGTSSSFDCDGVVEISGLLMSQSKQYTITNENDGESQTVFPINGGYLSIFFGNLCPSNYTNINGTPAGIYIFTVLDEYGCSKQLSINVETTD